MSLSFITTELTFSSYFIHALILEYGAMTVKKMVPETRLELAKPFGVCLQSRSRCHLGTHGITKRKRLLKLSFPWLTYYHIRRCSVSQPGFFEGL